MTSEGLRAFNLRKENKSGIYSHENKFVDFDTNYEKKFKENKFAWDFFVKQAPSYKRVIIHWIMTAKQEKTRLSRLEKVIKESTQQRRFNT